MSTRTTTGSTPGWLRDGLRWTGLRLRELLPRRADLSAMRERPGQDVIAGITVGVVALPLALAFGITSGIGAMAGLITAVVAGSLAAVFGGSNVQISGPTGAMTVVLVPIIAEFGPGGVLAVGVMAGALLVVAAVAGLGRYVQFIPLPVIEGFTLGIAVIIALQQIPAALGQHPELGHVLVVATDAAAGWTQTLSWQPVALCLGVAGVILAARRVRPTVPVALLAVIAATVLTALTHLPVTVIGARPRSLPAPSLPHLSLADLRSLVAPALAVAALAGLESLLSATVADAMSVSQRHDPDRELFGQGVANLVAPVFGGIPATAAIARTAVNVRTGARSRLSALVHAAVLLAVVLVLGPLVAQVPLAALAGVLIATAVRMVEVSSLRALLGSTRRDGLVLVLTFLATVVLDLATAVILGMVAAGALALRQLARSAQLRAVPLTEAGGPLSAEDADHDEADERALLDEHIVAYRLDGPLFFGAARSALAELSTFDTVPVVILRLSHVTLLDATGAAVLAETVRGLEGRGVTVLLSGLPQRFVHVLESAGVYQHLREKNHVFTGTPAAIAHARRHVARDGHHHAGTQRG